MTVPSRSFSWDSLSVPVIFDFDAVFGQVPRHKVSLRDADEEEEERRASDPDGVGPPAHDTTRLY